MNRFLIVAVVTAAALVGCQKSETGGNAGDDTFKVVVPTSTDVEQGEVQTIRVSVNRGAGFKRAVKLEVKAPKGLSVDPDSVTVKPGDKGDVQLAITAAKDAPLGDQQVMMKGTPDKGDAVELMFKVTVGVK